MKIRTLLIKTKSKNYKIYIGNKILNNIKKLLEKENIKFNKILIVKDKKINNKILNKIKSSLNKKEVYFQNFSSTEKNKDLINVNKLLLLLLKKKFSRDDCIVSIGGGIVGDLVCFVASIYKRGIKFVNIPTTLLAQVDSSIGGKSGINQKNYGKNLIGTFYQPDMVISDTSFLQTLNDRQILCGYAEILKHSLISSKSEFEYLDKNLENILSLKTPFIEETIMKSCRIKKEIVQKDEKEKNLRKLLNFGHTFGHAFEAKRNFKKDLAHGEAVILGINSAIKFSFDENLLLFKNYKKVLNHIRRLNFNPDINRIFKKKDIPNLIGFMENDKKNKSKQINLVLLKNIGNALINKEYDSNRLKKFFEKELYS